jgi:cobalt-zinc-cadmium efflux system protein
MCCSKEKAMAHNHSHHHSREGNIALVFFINLFFLIVELVGAILTNSLAVISNAIHDSGDVMALGFSWYLEKISKRKRDHLFSFGYRRFSLLGALINGIVLLCGTIFILREAISRLIYPEASDPRGMIGLAILGVIVNGLAAFRLRKGKTMNESILTLHLVEDILGWVAVLVVAFVMTLGDFPYLDPLLSLLFMAIIVYNAVGRIKKTLMIFLQSIPDDVDVKALEKFISGFKEVVEVHDTHVWSLDGQHHVLSTHVVVPPSMNFDDIDRLKNQIRIKLADFEIQHATIEVDYEGNSCEFVANPY